MFGQFGAGVTFEFANGLTLYVGHWTRQTIGVTAALWHWSRERSDAYTTGRLASSKVDLITSSISMNAIMNTIKPIVIIMALMLFWVCSCLNN